MAIIMDANVAMAIVKEEKEGLAIKDLILEGEDVFAPDLFKLEVASGFWKYVHAGYMKKDVALSYYQAACKLPTHYIRQNDLVPEVLQEATRLDHSIYDVVYLVLARRMGATFVSLDRKLVSLCIQEGIDCVEPVQL